MVSINDLIAIVPSAPKVPREPNIDWINVTADIKLNLPFMYKKLVEHLGDGSIGGFLSFLNPASKNPHLNLSSALSFQNSYETMKELFPEDYSRPSFPLKGSFLTWAITDNGDTFFWVIDGQPDEWIVGIHSRDPAEEEISGQNTSNFLFNLFSHQLTSNILPEGFLNGDLSFKAEK